MVICFLMTLEKSSSLSVNLWAASSLKEHFNIFLVLSMEIDVLLFIPQYDGESANKSQMDIRRKTYDSNLEYHLCLDRSSTNVGTLVPSLYHCAETRSMEVFWLLSQPLPHLRFNLFVIIERLPPSCEPFYATNSSHRKQETFLYEYPFH
jgi:hypothetical protein